MASSDAIVVIVGERGGWRTNSGKLVVEEEFEEALRQKLPVRVFGAAGVQRDADGNQLYTRLSDYEGGYFRKEYSSPEELRRLVAESLSNVSAKAHQTKSMDAAAIRAEVQKAAPDRRQHNAPSTVRLRIAVGPTRAGDVISATQIDDRGFQHALVSKATSPDYGLASYAEGLSPKLDGDDLVLSSGTPDPQQHRERPAGTTVVVKENGCVIIDLPLQEDVPSNNARAQYGMPTAFAASTLREKLTAALGFVAEIYEVVDPHRRYESFYVDTGLIGARGMELVDTTADLERSQGSVMHGHMMRMVGQYHGTEDPILFPRPAPEEQTRATLTTPGDYIENIILYTRRRMREGKA